MYIAFCLFSYKRKVKQNFAKHLWLFVDDLSHNVFFLDSFADILHSPEENK